MIRIEFNCLENGIERTITVEGNGTDVAEEVLTFHKNHFDILKQITDKLPPTLKFKVLLELLKDHVEVSEEGSDED